MRTRNTSNKNLALLAATTMVVAACGGSGNPGMAPPPAANKVPVISGITDKSGDQDTTINVQFGITDAESGAGMLLVSAAADGTGVFPPDGIVLSGSGETRSLSLTPWEAATGAATIAISVTDPQGATATRNFKVTVNARNASMRSTALDTFAKAEADEVTPVNGFTFEQDADDPAVFAALIPDEAL